MKTFVETMLDKGFPGYTVSEKYFLTNSRALFISKNDASFLKHIKDVDFSELSYEAIISMSIEYVESHIKSQGEDEDGEWWTDETYELWFDVFSMHAVYHLRANYEEDHMCGKVCDYNRNCKSYGLYRECLKASNCGECFIRTID